MFNFGFVYWSDIFLEHYAYSVLISIVVVIVTLFISKKYGVQNIGKAPDPIFCCGNLSSEQSFEKDQPMSTTCIKKSPALAAEKVIEANMTEEQRRLEYEVRQKQLAQIYELMQKQSEKFGNISLSEVKEQFKLYQ